MTCATAAVAPVTDAYRLSTYFARVCSTFLEGKQHNQHALCRLSYLNKVFSDATKEDDCDPCRLKEHDPL